MLNLADFKNSKLQGDVGLVHAILWFTQQGYGVFLPLTDSYDYDFVADVDGSLKKVQVRTTYRQSPYGVYVVNLRVLGGNRSGTGKVKNFEQGLYDYLFVVTDASTKYLIPSQVIENVNSLNLGEKYSPYIVT